MTKERAVHKSASIEPCADAIDNDFVEIIVSMPFEIFRGDPGVIDHGADDLSDRSGYCRPRIGNTKTKGIAEAYLYGDFGVFRKTHERLCKGYAEPVDIRPGNILKMAPRYNPMFQGALNNFQIVFECL